jgi:hypothetical protein
MRDRYESQVTPGTPHQGHECNITQEKKTVLLSDIAVVTEIYMKIYRMIE